MERRSRKYMQRRRKVQASRPKRLVGWSKVWLKAGESKDVTVSVDSKYLSIYDEAASAWKLVPGGYMFMVGGSSQELPLSAKADLK